MESPALKRVAVSDVFAVASLALAPTAHAGMTLGRRRRTTGRLCCPTAGTRWPSTCPTACGPFSLVRW
jgi:hypothetical protein